MRQRSFFVFCLTIIFCSVGFSQNSTVTNSDLQVYREKRLEAEREYRENYQRMGFPSPEELDRRREQSLKETEALSAKLRAERLQRESIEAHREPPSRLQRSTINMFRHPVVTLFTAGPGIIPTTADRRPFRIGTTYQTGYFAGGHFWPGGLGAPRCRLADAPPGPAAIRPRH